MIRDVLKLLTCSLALSLPLTGSAIAGKKNDTLVVPLERQVPTYDFYFQSTQEGSTFAQHILDTLLWRDLDTQEFRPLLATKWEWVNRKTLELELRKGVKFHNGDDFDADDVVYTLNWASDPKSKVLQQVQVNWIDRAEKIDQYKVRIHTKEENIAVLDFLATGVVVYPEAYHSKVGTDGFSRAPIGTGPYKVAEIQTGTSLKLEKNDNYFADSPKGKPQIKTILFKFIQDANIRMGELMTRQADLLSALTTDQGDRLRSVPGITVADSPSTYFSFLILKNAKLDHKSPIEDLRVRKAIAHGVNRDSMAKNLVRGQSNRLDTFCSPYLKGCLDGVISYDYNPAMAKKLLAEAGYPDGFTIDIYAYRDRHIAEAIIGDLRAIGINARLNYMQFPALRERWVGGQLTMSLMNWGGGGMDVSTTLSNYFLGGGTDPAHDPVVMETIRKGNGSATDEERFANYAIALKRLGEGVHWLPLYTYGDTYAFSDELDFKPVVNGVLRLYMAKWK